MRRLAVITGVLTVTLLTAPFTALATPAPAQSPHLQDGCTGLRSMASGNGINVRTAPDPNATSIAQLQQSTEFNRTRCEFTGGGYPALCGAPPSNIWQPIDWGGREAFVPYQCTQSVN